MSAVVELDGLSVRFGQRTILDLVAAGDHRNQLDRILFPAMRSAKARARFDRLRHGKRRAAGSETNEGLCCHDARLP